MKFKDCNILLRYEVLTSCLNIHFLQVSRNIMAFELEKEQTRRERLKSAPYLRLKKRKSNFLEKNLKFLKKNFFQKKSHSAEKCKRGTLLDLLTYIPLQNIKNLEGGPFGDIKKFSKKSRTVPKKVQRGGPFRHFRFCGFP